MPEENEKPKPEVIFEYQMTDSRFQLEKTGNSYTMTERMNDGTEIFSESVYHGRRLATILNRILTQDIG